MLSKTFMRTTAWLSVATIHAIRPFCVSKSSNKLVKTLSKELEYEKDNYAKLEDTETYLKTSGFSYSEDALNINCYLKKIVDGKEVTVHFQSRSPQVEEEEQ